MAQNVLAQLEEQVERIMLTPSNSERIEWEKAVSKECRYVTRLLATRMRSKQEIRQALEKREVSSDIIAEVLDRAVRSNLLDDERFAEIWVTERHRNKGLTGVALRQELKAKGVASWIIETTLDTHIDAQAERSKAKSLVLKRMDTQRIRPRKCQGTDRQKVVRRLHDHLQRKGYTSSLSLSVIYECLD